MSQDLSSNPLLRGRSSRKRGWGCRTVLVVMLALVVLAGLSLHLYQQHADHSAMRENLAHLGVGRWSDCPNQVEIWHVFSGSESHFYKLSIPPQEVEQFLAALAMEGCKRDTPKTVKSLPVNPNKPWWRPQDEKELLLVELRWREWPLWYIAAAKDTGHVYLYKVGH